MTRTLTLGHSPDPDDAFMFYALAKDKLDTGDLRFQHVLADIETLNRRAMRGALDITAVSLHAYAYVRDKYALLCSGASIGDNYGPMVVAREEIPIDRLPQVKIAVPGTMTTAFLVLNLAIGRFDYEVMPFDAIPEAVASGRVPAGLLIHEGQLTYEKHGLALCLELGQWWYETTGGLPLPLGVNAVRRDLGEELIGRVARVLRESIQYSLAHRREAVAYALGFGRGLDHQLADRFVGMYVNDFTVDYGPRGRRAVEELLSRAFAAGLIREEVRVEYARER
ncbi:ABC transporter substrate-binding protein [bacterium]|nr:ABC transporter substrate-binding protein [bacterium]